MSHALTGSGRGNYRGEGHWHARRGLLTALATGIFLEGAPKDPRHLGLQSTPDSGLVQRQLRPVRGGESPG